MSFNSLFTGHFSRANCNSLVLPRVTMQLQNTDLSGLFTWGLKRGLLKSW